MADATAVFDIIANDKASKTFSKVAKSAEGSTKHVSALSVGLKKFGAVAAVGFGLAAAGAVKFGVDAIGKASDLNETLSKSRVIFGKQADAMEAWGATGAKAFGLSKQAALDSAASFGDMFRQIGFAGGASAKMSKNVVQLAADLGSFNNLPTDEVLDMLAGGFRGEYDSLQRVIPNISAARVEHEALAATGKKTTKELTAQEKAAATLAIVQKDGARAAGDFARTSGGLANQQKILKAQFDNVQASIGTKLLPIAVKLATFANEKLVPAFSTFVTQMQSGVGAGGRFASAFQAVGNVLMSVFGFIANNKAAVGTFVTVLGTVVVTTKAWAAAQLLLNVALAANPLGLVVVALGALAAGLVYAYKHSEKFRAVVQTGFAAVKASAAAMANFFTSTIPSAFNKVKAAASSAINWVKGHWPLLLGVLTGPFGIAAVVIAKNWDKIVSGAKNAVGKVTGFFNALPGKILGAVGNLGSLLFNAGASIIQGLINGIQSKVGAVTSMLKGLTNKIPDWKGPRNRDKTLLTPAGEAIMQSLLNGFKKKWNPVKDFLQRITDKVKATGDKLAGLVSQRNDFASSFRSFSSSLFGRDTGQDAEGNAVPESVAGIKAFALKQRQDAEALARNVRRLVGLGLSKDLIMQMQAGGSAGLAQINALASGASAKDIRDLNTTNKATQDALTGKYGAGMAAANAIYGNDIKKAQADNAAMLKVMHDVRDELRGLSNGKLHAEVRGDQLVLVIRRDLKKKGKRDPFS